MADMFNSIPMLIPTADRVVLFLLWPWFVGLTPPPPAPEKRTHTTGPHTQEETGTCPLITPFGVHCLEKLGDTLLKNGEALTTLASLDLRVPHPHPSVFLASVTHTAVVLLSLFIFFSFVFFSFLRFSACFFLFGCTYIPWICCWYYLVACDTGWYAAAR